MKANLQDQTSLLKLSELDLAISINLTAQRDLASSNDVNAARSELLEMSDQLIDARNRLGELELQLKRSENDLELVERRLAQDRARLGQVQNQKDALGLQHEIETLVSRKSDLEDVEIQVLDALEAAKSFAEEILAKKSAAEDNLKVVEKHQEARGQDLEAKNSELVAERQRIQSGINPELIVAYERKSKRGTAVARLVGRDCGACRLSITASVLDEITQLPADEMAECPSCQAFLVR